MRGRSFCLGVAAAALLVVPAPAAGAPTVAGEFDLPAGFTVGANNEIVQGPDGNMWVTTEQAAIVRIAPDGSAVAFEPPGMTSDASGITVGPDGNLWAAQSAGVIMIPPGNPLAADQTNVGIAGGQGIAVGPDASIWLAGANALVSIPPASPATFDNNAVTLNGPKGMATGSDGLLWIADGANIVSATAAATPVLTPYPIGNSAGGSQDVAAGPNAQVAYVNPVDDPQGVGLISPGGTPQKVNLENSDPFGVTFGQDGAYWVARSATNDLLRLTTGGQTSTLTGFAPSGGVGPRKIATGPDNTLWVTLDTPEKVAKVTGVDPPSPPPPPPPPGTSPSTTLDKGAKKKVKTSKRRAKVTFEFSSPTAGAAFECTLTKKGKAPRTKPCTSPVTYKLKPGRYTFGVAAAAGGLTDETAATDAFKVVRRRA